MKTPRNLLIPTLKFNDVPSVRQFSKHFGKTELDLFGVKQRITPYQNSRLAIFKAILDSSKLSPHSVHLRFFDLSLDDSESRDRCISTCNNIHRIFKPNVVVIHPGRGDISTLVSNIAFLVERIPAELNLAFENMTHPDALINSPETVKRFIELLKDLPSNVGLCIDTSHCPAWLEPETTGEEYTSLLLEYLEAASPRLKHLHFSDLLLKGKEMLKHLPIGKGLIDWQKIDAYLLKIEYKGKATIEIRFTEDVSGDILASATQYYGTELEERLLILEGGNQNMPELDMIRKEEMLEKVAKLPSIGPVPETVSRLLNMPKEGLLEQTEDFLYFVSPSENYNEGHDDPYDALIGESRDTINWGRYVFGIRYHGTNVSAVLIDKERKISIAETILKAHGDGNVHWENFESVVRRALDSAKNKEINERINLDHVNITSVGDIEYIESTDPRAWERDWF